MKKVAVVTSTRAEYGLLFPLIKRIAEDDQIILDLIVTGGHLSRKQGNTIREIECNGFSITHQIPILEENDAPRDISLTMANALKCFGECFDKDRPDLLIVLGDRTEILSVVISAVNERIPVAHIHGGEVTAGAVDDCIRHAITKMSYLHFTSCEQYRKRVIQLGEFPDRVFNVGSLGVENVLNQELMTMEELSNEIGLNLKLPYIVVTFHPVTLEENTGRIQAEEICKVIEDRTEYNYLITASNTDSGGQIINKLFKNLEKRHNNVHVIESLGMKRYLSVVKGSEMVLGNSSSGMIEVPALGVPTVNIGDRQKGRISADSVVCCSCDARDISIAIDKARSIKRLPSRLFGDGKTSERILRIIKEFLFEKRINLKKGFYDLDFEI